MSGLTREEKLRQSISEWKERLRRAKKSKSYSKYSIMGIENEIKNLKEMLRIVIKVEVLSREEVVFT